MFLIGQVQNLCFGACLNSKIASSIKMVNAVIIDITLAPKIKLALR
jgi:hypothetical protein